MVRKSPIPLPFLLPILAALFVAVWGGGLGVLFMILAETSLGHWSVVILGVVLVVAVPTIAALVSSALDSPRKERKS